ncbi:MAG: PilX N-terminal domain-containing pilus assembly protein [Pseudomonadota bacterium]
MNSQHLRAQTLFGKPPQRQRGVVMVIALIAVLLLSLIGTTAMRSSTIQEKISGNMRDQDVAFQAAEAALHDAEEFLDNLTTLALFNDTTGLYTTGNAPDVYLAWPADARVFNGGAYGALGKVASEPQYIIEIRGTVDESVSTSLNLSGGYGVGSGAGDIFVFKIHARGTGLSNTSQVVLRSNFAKRF